MPAGGKIAAQSTSGAIIRTALANGLVLVVRENPATQLVAVTTRIAGGSGADSARSLAAARTAVSAERTGGSVAARVRLAGSSIDVSVDGDSTTFVSIVDTRGAGAVIEAHARLLEPLPPSATVVPAAPRSDPGDFATAAFARTARAARGIADGDDAGPAGSADIAAFIAIRYRTNRASIVVAGNVNPFNVTREVQVVFGALASADVVPPPAPPPAPVVVSAPAPTPVSSTGYRFQRADCGIAYATVGYPVGGILEPGGAAAEIAVAALACGRTSRLGRLLVGAGLAASVDGRVVWGERGGAIVVQVGCDPKRIDAVEAALFREIDRFRRERMSDAELQRARNIFELRFVRSVETIEGEAESLATFEQATDDPGARAAFAERVRALGAADVQTAAVRLLASNMAVVDELLPFDAPDRTFTAAAFADTVRAWAPGSSDAVDPSSVRAAEPAATVAEGSRRRQREETGEAVLLPVPVGVRDFSTLNGPKAFVREDQSRPILSIGFYFPAGRASEAADERGITVLMLRAMLEGSRARPGDKVLKDLEQLGAEAHAFAGPDYFGIVVDVVSRNADLAMDIAIEAIEHPTFAKEPVARARDALLLDQRAARANAGPRSVELFWQNRFPTHAYGAPELGLPDAVARLTDEKLKAWYARSIASQYPLAGIVGDTDGSSLVSRHLTDSFDRPEGEPTQSAVLPPPNVTGESVDMTRRNLTVQTLGFPCPGLKWPALDALDVVGAACGAIVERRRLGGALRTTIDSAVGDESRDRDRALASMSRVVTTELADDELSAARTAAAVAYYRRGQTFDAMALLYVDAAACGTPLDSVETYGDRIRAITAGDVRRTAAAVMIPATGGRGIVRGQP